MDRVAGTIDGQVEKGLVHCYVLPIPFNDMRRKVGCVYAPKPGPVLSSVARSQAQPQHPGQLSGGRRQALMMRIAQGVRASARAASATDNLTSAAVARAA
jgi:hypothetical protein